MFAIFQTGGKQYQVQKGDVIYTEKLTQQVGEDVVFDQVLMVDNNTGTPFVPNAKVIATVEKQGKQKKIEVIKFKSKKHHFKRQGHRQPYTKLVIKDIQF